MSLQVQFREFTSKCYAEQAKAFLNAYWKEAEGQAEDVWNWTHKFIELDIEKEKEGCDVDEFTAHRFLESLSETMTVKEMRVALSEADLDFNKRIALLEYCLWKFGKSVTDFVARPKGDPEQLRKAEEMLAAVQKLVEEAQAKAQEAKAKAQEAKQKEKEADEAAAPFRAAEAELAAALAELQAQEDAYNGKIEELKKKSEEGGVVSRNRAKNELAQLKAEDPLPLRTAKITTEAARKRAEKAKEPFEIAHANAIAAREAADAAAAAAEDAAAAADAAVDEAQAKFKEAEVKFQELKDAGAGAGNIWWMEREVTEMKKYMPLKKGGIAKK